MERAVVLADGDTLHPRDLNLSFHAPALLEASDPWSGFDFSGTLNDVVRRAQSEVEKRKIEQAVKEAGDNKGTASEILQVSYKTFLMKLKDYGIE